MAGFSIKGRSKFGNMIQRRNENHNLFTHIGNAHNNIVQDFHKTRKAFVGNVQKKQQEFGRAFDHIRKHGLDSDGDFGSFQHEQAGFKFSGKVGAHRGKTSNDGWNSSKNSLKATALQGNIQGGGKNWDFSGKVKVGDVDVNANHLVLKDDINIRDGLKNGPKGSASAKADVFNFQGKGSFGTDKDNPLGIRLKADVSAVWGMNAGINADIEGGIGPFHANPLNIKTNANVNFVIDHKSGSSGDRKELATFTMKDGKVNAKVRWKEVGNVLKEQKFDGFMDLMQIGYG